MVPPLQGWDGHAPAQPQGAGRPAPEEQAEGHRVMYLHLPHTLWNWRALGDPSLPLGEASSLPALSWV